METGTGERSFHSGFNFTGDYFMTKRNSEDAPGPSRRTTIQQEFPQALDEFAAALRLPEDHDTTVRDDRDQAETKTMT